MYFWLALNHINKHTYKHECVNIQAIARRQISPLISYSGSPWDLLRVTSIVASSNGSSPIQSASCICINTVATTQSTNIDHHNKCNQLYVQSQNCTFQNASFVSSCITVDV